MNKKLDLYKLGYILSITIFIIGLRISLSWSYNNRFVGVFISLCSIALAYYIYRKTTPLLEKERFEVNRLQLLAGIALVILVFIYNFLALDELGSFDIGMLVSGFIIILLNLGVLNFLNLTKNSISFITYFLFITMILYGFLFSGLPFIAGDKDNNLFFDFVTKSVAALSAILLNFIKPTSYYGNVIDFDSFVVYIGDACSGVESISIFLSAALAYMISIKSKDYKKMVVFIFIGIIILYIINILRVMSIILAGYYISLDAFYLVHRHLGWIFFVIGMSFFWYLLINNFKPNDK
ncbi:exosortase/archaeosortase family protein [Methanolobus sp. WCC4]|uniref:exosortase/archaeosortase family protein n=1 Tax=Methanolobus sp. WCC4 TaxID=3125784 RepID=UPI0030F4D66D